MPLPCVAQGDNALVPWQTSGLRTGGGETARMRQPRLVPRYLCISDGDSVVKARVLTCVEGLNLPLLERAIADQRKYQRERGCIQ